MTRRLCNENNFNNIGCLEEESKNSKRVSVKFLNTIIMI